MRIFATILIAFFATQAASDTLFQAKVWVSQNNTQIRIKSEIYSDVELCRTALEKMKKVSEGRGYKAMSSDEGSYKGFNHSSYLASFAQNNMMITCTTLP